MIYIASIVLPLKDMKTPLKKEFDKMGVVGFFPIFKTAEEANQLIDEVGLGGVVIEMEHGGE